MKVRSLFFMMFAAAGLMLTSCADEAVGLAEEPVAEGTGVATTIKVVIPSGAEAVRVEYPTADGMNSMNVPIDVDVNYSERYGACAITTGEIKLASPVATTVNVYDMQGTLLAKNVPVAAVDGTVAGAAMMPEDAVKNYVSSDANQIFYHSSGVAMFDDSWPKTYTKDEDYNDVVIDYDIETKYVDMSVIPDQAWREQVKVVMHLRSMGGEYPTTAGLYLESLDTKYITNVETSLSLGNMGDFNAENMGITYDVNLDGEHPLITFNNLQWLVSEEAKTATYEKNGQAWFVNPRDPSKIAINNNPLPYTDKIADTFYNVNAGIINTGGSLFTLTVIFKGIDRNELSAEEGQKQIEHFINATMDVNKQNFFIGCHTEFANYLEVHMKGYDPTPDYTSYDAHNAIGVAKDNSTTYSGADGSIYGMKVPVMTRHAYEKKPFHLAYPEFEAWFESNGESNADWYLRPDGYATPNIPSNYVSCEW